MNDLALLSVDLDFFNHLDSSGLYPLVSRCCDDFRRQGIPLSVRIQTDHIISTAYPNRKAWRNYTVWNYDEHDDCGPGSQEEIGTWGSCIMREHAALVWVADQSTHYSCGGEPPGCVHLIDDISDMPLPEIPIAGLAFFVSPGYLDPDRAGDVCYHLWAALEQNDMKVNGRAAASWPWAKIKALMTAPSFY